LFLNSINLLYPSMPSACRFPSFNCPAAGRRPPPAAAAAADHFIRVLIGWIMVWFDWLILLSIAYDHRLSNFDWLLLLSIAYDHRLELNALFFLLLPSPD
jgi:hypothetical protein